MADVQALGKRPMLTLGPHPHKEGLSRWEGHYLSIILSLPCLSPSLGSPERTFCLYPSNMLPDLGCRPRGMARVSGVSGQWPGDSAGGWLRAGLSVPEGHLASVQP